MAVLWTAPEHATRYAPHVEELRDFFALERLHTGAPEDLVALAGRLDASDSFRDDLSSMVRVILLREGGSIPRADLLEIITVAIGGAEIDQAPQEMQHAGIQQPIQQIFAFLNGVLRKPWNQPPGEDRLAPQPMPDAFAPQPVAASEDPPTAEAEASPIPSPEAALLSSPEEPAISTPEQAQPQQARVFSPPENEPAAAPAPSPAFVRPESVYSRLADFESEQWTWLSQTPALTAPDLEPDAEPPAALESGIPLAPDASSDPLSASAPEIPPPPEPHRPFATSLFAAKIFPWPKPILDPPDAPTSETYSDLELEQSPTPAPNIFFPPPLAPDLPSLAAEPHTYAAAPLAPPSTLDPEPPSPASFPALRVPNWKFAAPRIHATLHSHPSQLRTALISGAGAILIVATLMYSAHRSANSVLEAATRPTPAASPTPSPTPSTAPSDPPVAEVAETAIPAAAPAIPAAVATAAPIATPSPSSSAAAQPRHVARRIRDDGYIAPPWSGPIPGQQAARVSTPATPSPSTPAAPSPASLASARTDKPDKPIAPDVSPMSAPARHLSVSSGEMALLSAPPPGYPMLAKIAHLQGQVVVQAEVDPSGTVSAAHVLSGHRLLRGAALDAVLHRRYRPYRVDGHPVEVSTTITVNFPPPSTPAAGKHASAYAGSPAH